eukprot:jgi/Psemu1/324932/estExt_fgenesh1_pg.C_1880007
MRGPNVRQVTVDDNVPNLFDDSSDDDSGWTHEDPAQFWAGRNRSYPSKKDSRLGRSRDADDADDASGSGSQGSYAMVTPTGSLRASPVSAVGLFTMYHNQTVQQQQRQQRQQPQTARPSSADTIVEDLTRSEMELDQMEADMWGFEGRQVQIRPYEEGQERELEQEQDQERHQDEDKFSALTDASSAAVTVPSAGEVSGDSSPVAKSKKRGSVLLWTIGIFIFLAMCGLFAFGGYLLYQNNYNNEDSDGEANETIEASDGE